MHNMKALIFDNKVVDIKETEFEVHNSMTWVDCDNTVKQGFSYDGSTFTSNEPTAEEKSKFTTMKEKAISGKAKLKALGLDDEEIKSLIGI